MLRPFYCCVQRPHGAVRFVERDLLHVLPVIPQKRGRQACLITGFWAESWEPLEETSQGSEGDGSQASLSLFAESGE